MHLQEGDQGKGRRGSSFPLRQSEKQNRAATDLPKIRARNVKSWGENAGPRTLLPNFGGEKSKTFHLLQLWLDPIEIVKN